MSDDTIKDVMEPDSDSAVGQVLGGLQSALNWAYDAALDGLPGFGSLEELVESYRSGGGDEDSQIDSLIAWQVAKAGTSGFVTGLGGVITMPAAVPANIAGIRQQTQQDQLVPA